MPLTPVQQSAIKAYVEADTNLNSLPHTLDGAFSIAAAINAIASPAFVVWKTSVSQDEIMQNGFDWVRVDNLSVGKSRIWEWMFQNESRSINPSKLNVRAGIDEVWKGTAADLAVREAVYVHCKRNASIVEQLLATGSGTNESPATMQFEGPVGYIEIFQAMQW